MWFFSKILGKVPHGRHETIHCCSTVLEQFWLLGGNIRDPNNLNFRVARHLCMFYLFSSYQAISSISRFLWSSFPKKIRPTLNFKRFWFMTPVALSFFKIYKHLSRNWKSFANNRKYNLGLNCTTRSVTTSDQILHNTWNDKVHFKFTQTSIFNLLSRPINSFKNSFFTKKC